MEYVEKIVDATTGEITIRPYTKEEIAEVELAQKELLEKMAIIEERKAKRQSALNKLIDLGLTEEEIAAL